jgi:putative hydrolase of HD superfamily
VERNERLELYIPKPEDGWFYEKMVSDPETMAYNAPWFPPDGTIPHPEKEWKRLCAEWIGAEPERFYAYLRRPSDGAFVGDVCFHETPEHDQWDMGVVIFAPERGKGCGTQGLRLLAEHAFSHGVKRLHNTFETTRGAAYAMHRAIGFRETGRKDGTVDLELTEADFIKGRTHMEPREFLDILHVAERLKDTMRHCTTSKGRRESVAEHSWRISLMAMLLKSEFPDVDIDKVTRMCLIHDLGECFTGDIPTFLKTAENEQTEEELLDAWVKSLPAPVSEEMTALYAEMNAQRTPEARLYKSLDKLEAVIQHNESPIETWEPHEYELNKTYAFDTVAFSDWLTALRREIYNDTVEKIEANK